MLRLQLKQTKLQLVDKVGYRKKMHKFQSRVYVHAFQRVVGVQRSKPLVALRRVRNSPTRRRSARGELKNSPVDCFLRGDALQERASLLYSFLVMKILCYFAINAVDFFDRLKLHLPQKQTKLLFLSLLGTAFSIDNIRSRRGNYLRYRESYEHAVCTV